MKHRICLITVFLFVATFLMASPIKNLLERIDKGASDKFIVEQVKSADDFFELDQIGEKVVIRGNNYVSIATGLNWYLKYYANIHLSWNGMAAKLPAKLPVVAQKERRETKQIFRYDLNYCTFSYSMAFWDWERWEKEIDWMALHGINMPLTLTGSETVWYRVLDKLGYTKKEINEFISGPGFFAWWLMNNLESWGGPNPDRWYEQQVVLQKKIMKRMKEFGIKPVLPGYAGMVPNNAKEKLGLNVSDPGIWCGYRRPAFLQPTDPNFERIANLYYQEMDKLFGKADYYAIDPFHEGGSVAGVDLEAAGKAIMKAMKKANPKAIWVVQAWQENPRSTMIDSFKEGEMLVLDLFSEGRPQWGEPTSTWYREKGYGKHNWVYCMLLNYGANVGLHGKMDYVIDGFYDAKTSAHAAPTLRGVGITPEGIENNPVMYELAMELPWRPERFTKEEWLPQYLKARYGASDPVVENAWTMLSNSIYNCPKKSTQQGAHESVFCARPVAKFQQVSSFSETSDYYNPQEVIRAAKLLVSVAPKYKGNNNFEYDLVDILRQAIAEKGKLTHKAVMAAYEAGDNKLFKVASERFLELILLQDELLGTRAEFRVGPWINSARSLGVSDSEKALYEWNARVQISTWGNRHAANNGRLRDYAHKEWSGILKDFYYKRWQVYFEHLSKNMNGEKVKDFDFYPMEEAWANASNSYSNTVEGESVSVACSVFSKVFE